MNKYPLLAVVLVVAFASGYAYATGIVNGDEVIGPPPPSCTSACSPGQIQCASGSSYYTCTLASNGCYYWSTTTSSCPSKPNACSGNSVVYYTPVCSNNACGYTTNTIACSTLSPTNPICTGSGVCVQCTSSSDCPAPQPVCSSGRLCNYAPTCSNNICGSSLIECTNCATGVCGSSTSCLAQVCGDGKVSGSEQCDDGNTITESCPYGQATCTVCGSSCQWTASTGPHCGDGVVQPNEQCEGSQSQSQACGNCGTQSRSCISCSWSAWGTCTGEGCSPGSSTQCSTVLGSSYTGTAVCQNNCQYDTSFCSQNLCAGVVCNSPPNPECINPVAIPTLTDPKSRVYNPAGSCTVANGQARCSYSYTDTHCPNNCNPSTGLCYECGAGQCSGNKYCSNGYWADCPTSTSCINGACQASLSVSPPSYIIGAGTTLTITASGTAASSATWSASGGSVSPASGSSTTYTAPYSPGTYTVTASSSGASASSSITVEACTCNWQAADRCAQTTSGTTASNRQCYCQRNTNGLKCNHPAGGTGTCSSGFCTQPVNECVPAVFSGGADYTFCADSQPAALARSIVKPPDLDAFADNSCPQPHNTGWLGGLPGANCYGLKCNQGYMWNGRECIGACPSAGTIYDDSGSEYAGCQASAPVNANPTNEYCSSGACYKCKAGYFWKTRYNKCSEILDVCAEYPRTSSPQVFYYSETNPPLYELCCLNTPAVAGADYSSWKEIRPTALGSGTGGFIACRAIEHRCGVADNVCPNNVLPNSCSVDGEYCDSDCAYQSDGSKGSISCNGKKRCPAGQVCTDANAYCTNACQPLPSSAPLTSISPDGRTSNAPITFTLSCSANGGASCRTTFHALASDTATSCSGASYSSYSGPVTIDTSAGTVKRQKVCYYSDNTQNIQEAPKLSNTFVVDKKSPTCAASLSESSNYAYVSGNIIYYNPAQGGSFSVSANSDDSQGSGIDRIEFPATTSSGTTATPGSNLQLYSYTHTYTWTTTSNFVGTANVNCYDKVNNLGQAVIVVQKDTTPPSVGPCRIPGCSVAWPNPFSPDNDGVSDTTTIRYYLSETASVTIEIRAPSGAVVRTLGPVLQQAEENSMVWDGKNSAGVVVADGTYSVYITATDMASNTMSATFFTSVTVQTQADLLPPVRSNGRPTGTIATTSTTLSLDTNEPATCRYSTTPGTPYDSMSGTFTTTGGMSHSTQLSGLTTGQKNYYVRCMDRAGNKNTDDFVISFTMNTNPPSTRPARLILGQCVSGQTVTIACDVTDADNNVVSVNGWAGQCNPDNPSTQANECKNSVPWVSGSGTTYFADAAMSPSSGTYTRSFTINQSAGTAIGATCLATDALGSRSVNADGTWQGDAYHLCIVSSSAPTLTGISPSSGARGTTFTAVISGTNLAGATSVTFSGTGVTATIQDATATSITVQISIDASADLGYRTITVTTPSGTVTANSAFTVISSLVCGDGFCSAGENCAADTPSCDTANGFACTNGCTKTAFLLTISKKNPVYGETIYAILQVRVNSQGGALLKYGEPSSIRINNMVVDTARGAIPYLTSSHPSLYNTYYKGNEYKWYFPIDTRKFHSEVCIDITDSESGETSIVCDSYNVQGAPSIEPGVSFDDVTNRIVPLTPSGEPNYTRSMKVNIVADPTIYINNNPSKCDAASCEVTYKVDDGSYASMSYDYFRKVFVASPLTSALSCDTYHTIYVLVNKTSEPEMGLTGSSTKQFFVSCEPRITISPVERRFVIGERNTDAYEVTIWNPRDATDYTLRMSTPASENSYILGWLDLEGDINNDKTVVISAGATSPATAKVYLNSVGAAKAGSFMLSFTAEPYGTSTRYEAMAPLLIFSEGLDEFAAWQLFVLVLASLLAFWRYGLADEKKNRGFRR